VLTWTDAWDEAGAREGRGGEGASGSEAGVK
jgi:hypothetical protein